MTLIEAGVYAALVVASLLLVALLVAVAYLTERLYRHLAARRQYRRDRRRTMAIAAVYRGDTLDAIARRHNMTVASLMSANRPYRPRRTVDQARR